MSVSSAQPLLRERPLVFISSAIAGLTDLRERIAQRLGALGLVEQWLFEVHATAAGPPSEAHYLDIARSCDLMVVIVGDRRTEGTEDEYDEAYLDNPDKILPFFLGAGSAEVRAFRAKLEQPNRHVRKLVATNDELVEAVVEAIRSSVLSGRLLSGPLRRALSERLDELDQLLRLEPPRSYLPALEMASQRVTWSDAWNRHNSMTVEGPGGAGKTYGALVALHQLTRVDRVPIGERPGREQAALEVVLPLYLRATTDVHRVPRLIAQAFATARFFPGEELTDQYAREGRLAIVIDGHDDLDGSGREVLLESLREWQIAYPRCRVALLARAITDGQLAAFHRLKPAPFEERHIVEMFECEGRPIRGMIDVPAELTDLVQWPFWCGALARYGLDAGSGLALLQEVIEGRLGAALADPTRAVKLRAVLGRVALRAHPSSAFTVQEALEWVTEWNGEASTRERFAPEPAETLIEAARRSGLLQAESQQLAFLHPLLAAVLAAEAGLADPLQPAVRASAELSVFCAALLQEADHEALLELLTSNDIFFAARVLRLYVPTQRSGQLTEDLERYQRAVRALAALAGPDAHQLLAASSVKAVQEPEWTAWTHVIGDQPEVLDGYDALSAVDPDSDIVMWPEDPFAELLPEHLAVAEVLLRFKQSFDQLTHKELERDGPVPPAPADRDILAERLLEQVRAVAAEEQDLREQAGLASSKSLPTLDGEPHLRVTASNGGRWIQELWGFDEAEVDFEDDDDFEDRDDVARLLSQNAADAARKRLRQNVEKTIGSALGSAAWNRPTALAGWIW